MSKCINCGEEGPHFVPPSLGEEGFFYCKRAPYVKGRAKNDTPYPWCYLPEKCSVSGRCEKQFLPNGVNCGE